MGSNCTNVHWTVCIEKEIDSLKKSAEQGNGYAQYVLGDMYGDGTIIKKDIKLAFQWMEKAAIQGFVLAQVMLGGEYYYRGIGVEADFIMAFQWMKQAADQNFAPAQYQIGKYYYMAQGIVVDYGLSFQWTKKSADQNFAPAQYQIGKYYGKGIMVKRDPNEPFTGRKKQQIRVLLLLNLK